ncbi:MAG: hypothetical protein HZC28_17115 [Spirochaetes bacterium]|nr:hypothetical protein [Spirochaetota bacterium]
MKPLCIITLIISMTAAAFAGLVNPAFNDRDGDGRPDGWDFRPEPNGTTTKILLKAVDAGTLVRFKDEDTKQGLGLAQTIPVTGGKTYRETLRIKKGALSIYFLWLDSEKKQIGKECFKPCTGGDETSTVEYIETAPANAVYCTMWIYSPMGSTTDVILTDASFEEAPGQKTAAPTTPAAGVSDNALFGFETAGWSGIELTDKNVKEGKTAGLWKDHDKNKSINLDKFNHDWSGYTAMRFWLHSAKPTGETMIIVLTSRKDPKVFSYYSQMVVVNWEGWKEIILPFSKFQVNREPVGWKFIESIQITVDGWGLKPYPDSVLTLDGLTLQK